VIARVALNEGSETTSSQGRASFSRAASLQRQPSPSGVTRFLAHLPPRSADDPESPCCSPRNEEQLDSQAELLQPTRDIAAGRTG
jgi:hypothetical protein